MDAYNRVIVACFLVFILSGNAIASIHIEWGYTPPDEPAVTGFRLYQNGTEVQNWLNPDATSGDAEITPIIGDSFTLTALFADETESPHSGPFIWTGDTPIIIFHHWLWFGKASHKRVRVGGSGLKGARLR